MIHFWMRWKVYLKQMVRRSPSKKIGEKKKKSKTKELDQTGPAAGSQIKQSLGLFRITFGGKVKGWGCDTGTRMELCTTAGWITALCRGYRLQFEIGACDSNPTFFALVHTMIQGLLSYFLVVP